MSRLARPVVILVSLLLLFIYLRTWRTSSTPLNTYLSTNDNISSAHEEANHSNDIQLPIRPLVNATFIMLARNTEIWQAISSIKAVEDRFNKNFHYPWVFLNDEPFTEEFIRRTSAVTSGSTQYGLIPEDHWYQPDFIDEEKAALARARLKASNVIYGDSVSYRNMCRFNSGFFYRHELMLPYRYYWRVEPGIQYFCDIERDPFLFMQENNKSYGFTITMKEIVPTVTGLWRTVVKFKTDYPQYIAEDNASRFLSRRHSRLWNFCHFWSNFEIGDMEFYRGEAYTKYFEYLDQKGGFYYERWGDAPVHSIAAALLLNRDQIHFFDEIGYRHDPVQHCPQGELHEMGRCSCDPTDNYDDDRNSCMDHWRAVFRQKG